MGLLQVTLEDERCRVVQEMVSDPRVLDSLLAQVEGVTEFPCLRFIDPYGDTIFNRIQAQQLLIELDALRLRVTQLSQQSALREISEFARRCSDQPHLYIRFQGD